MRATINPAQPFAVRIANGAPQPMIEGERNAFRLESQRDGFAQLYLLRASGTVLVVAENLPVRSHAPRVFPDGLDGFDLRAQPPAGTDTALLVVTAQPFTAGLGPAAVPARLAPAVSPLARNAFVDRLGAALGQLQGDTWNSTTTSVEVMVRK